MKWLYLYLFLVLLETLRDQRRAINRGLWQTPLNFALNFVALPFLLWDQLRDL